MGQTWGLGLPEVDLCPGEEVGDSAVVGSLVPLIPEDLCEESLHSFVSGPFAQHRVYEIHPGCL